MNKRQFDKAERIFDALDSDPRLWTVYGETIRNVVTMAETELQRYRRANEVIRGSTGEKDCTVRYLQMTWKKRLWRERPHICQNCGRPLTWAIHRIHHVIALKDGGQFTEENLRSWCVLCHMEDHEHRKNRFVMSQAV